MTKIRASSFFFIFLLLGLVFTVPAQEGEEEEPGSGEIPIESDWSVLNLSVYDRGDQTFNISLGIIFPTVFFNDGDVINNKIFLGGTGSLSYNYFFNSHFFVGGELSGMFATTKGQNTVFIIPIGVRVGYQFILGRFEFPLVLMIGGAPQKFLDDDYFGLFVKPSASAFFRFNSDWSFGLNTAWWWVPQWTSDPDTTVYGNFLEITLSARYHF
jgi:hypothetical protein